MRQMWGSLSVSDHLRSRALVAEVLLFDRVVVPVPPDDDAEEKRRWQLKKWNPHRQRRFLDILGDGPTDRDLAVTVPWTPAKRAQFRAVSGGDDDKAAVRNERQELLRKLDFDAQLLESADAYHLTRMILTREYDPKEEQYARQLPRADVEAVVPAYSTFKDADRDLELRADTAPNASLIGWSLLLPADSSWTDGEALERAAALARKDDYREKRDEFRNWWRIQMLRDTPPKEAVKDLAGRAARLNDITRAQERRTRTLRTFAILGSGVGIAGVWFPPAAVVGGALALVGVGGEWLWRDREPVPSTAPAAMFTDAHKHFGMA